MRGRGVSGGLSGGAGIDVPSVREKLTGVSVSGFHSSLLVGMMDDRYRTRFACADSCMRFHEAHEKLRVDSGTRRKNRNSAELGVGRSSGGVDAKEERARMGVVTRQGKRGDRINSAMSRGKKEIMRKKQSLQLSRKALDEET